MADRENNGGARSWGPVVSVFVVMGVLAYLVGSGSPQVPTKASPAPSSSGQKGPADPETVRLYAAAMKTEVESGIGAADPLFRRTYERDPEMAAALLRHAIAWVTTRGDVALARRAFQMARDREARLTPSDKALVQAIAPFFELRPDRTKTVKDLSELSTSHPDDQELHAILGDVLLDLVGDAPHALEQFDAARKLGTYPWAVGDAARAMMVLGKKEEARALVDGCVAERPSAGSCEAVRAKMLSDEGACAEEETQVRAWTGAGDDYEAWWTLAEVLASRGADRAEIEGAVGKARGSFPNEDPHDALSRAGISLATWIGDLGKALELAKKRDSMLEKAAGTGPERDAAAYDAVRLQLETGDDKGAVDTARAALHHGAIDLSRETSDYEGGLIALAKKEEPAAWSAFEAGTKNALDHMAHVPRLPRAHFWASRFANTADGPEGAKQAVKVADDLGVTPAELPYDAALLLAEDYAAAGMNDRATTTLKTELARCNALEAPVDRLHATLVLAKLREQAGETKEAVALYKSILAVWGKASPRSVTADEARRRLQALGGTP